MSGLVEVRRLGVDDVGLIARIDRSEHLELEYTVRHGELVERPASRADVPPWDQVGTGPWSVAVQVGFCEPLLRDGATLFGAFEGKELLGLAVVAGSFEPDLAWLAYLHVSRPHRGRGVASALWDAALGEAVLAGATTIYVSSAPTESAVPFYLSRGCELAEPVHATLFAKEPDDIHFVCKVELPEGRSALTVL